MDITYQRLTPEEIKELNVHKAQIILANNSNSIIDINGEMMSALDKLGRAKIEVDKLKFLKDCIVEQNRALKTVMSNG